MDVSETPTVPTPAIVEDIQRVLSLLGEDKISRSEYLQKGIYSIYQIYEGGRTWEDICSVVGIKTKKKEPISDQEYFVRLQKAYDYLGRLPKTSERKRFGLNFSKRRYPTLRLFIEEAEKQGIIPKQHSSEPDVHNDNKIDAPRTKNLEPNRDHSTPPIPEITERNRWKRVGISGFPYAPHDELGVVCLFGILCYNNLISWQILELKGGKGIDATCWDPNSQREIRVEIKHTLSRSSWNHKVEDLDYVVCWENRWLDFPKPVIELSELISAEKIKTAIG